MISTRVVNTPNWSQALHFVAFGAAVYGVANRSVVPAFTPSAKTSWIALYDAVQAEMLVLAQIRANS